MGSELAPPQPALALIALQRTILARQMVTITLT